MNAFQSAIDQLVSEIAIRQDALSALQKLSPVETPSKTAKPFHVEHNGRSKPQPAGKALEVCRKLREPFSSRDIADALQVSLKAAQSTVSRFAKKQLIVKKGFGAWVRGPKFPGNGAPLETRRVTIPGLDKEDKGLAERIKETCRERDGAVASGHDRLASILQDKVDKLQAELEEMEARKL